MTCSFEGCGRVVAARGLCGSHWSQWRHRCGRLSPLHTSPHGLPAKPVEQRFWRFVAKGANDECWLWTGAKADLGYGKFYLSRERKGERAHRVAWEMLRGAIPIGLYVLHNCPGGDNPACVNPNHLFLGTKRDNSRDMVAKGRNVYRIRIGEANNKARLTSEAVRAIRSALVSGVSASSLARQFGVHHSTVQRVAAGRTWRHVA